MRHDLETLLNGPPALPLRRPPGRPRKVAGDYAPALRLALLDPARRSVRSIAREHQTSPRTVRRLLALLAASPLDQPENWPVFRPTLGPKRAGARALRPGPAAGFSPHSHFPPPSPADTKLEQP